MKMSFIHSVLIRSVVVGIALLFLGVRVGNGQATTPDPSTAPYIKSSSTIAGALATPPATRSLTRSISAEERPKVDIQAILFKFGTAEVDGQASYEQIKQLGTALMDPRLKGAKLQIEGHTDSVGSDEFNQKLSEKRAVKVVELLSGLYGIPKENLQAVGKGKADPVADNDTEVGRAQNRRVTVIRQE